MLGWIGASNASYFFGLCVGWPYLLFLLWAPYLASVVIVHVGLQELDRVIATTSRMAFDFEQFTVM